LSVRVPSRASETVASCLPTSGCKPKFVVSEERVGAQQLCTPSRPAITRAIVPFPDRFGPTSASSFSSRASGEDVADHFGERLP
jgi:hypothetical protein